jgi:hypothetical protein
MTARRRTGAPVPHWVVLLLPFYCCLSLQGDNLRFGADERFEEVLEIEDLLATRGLANKVPWPQQKAHERALRETAKQR